MPTTPSRHDAASPSARSPAADRPRIPAEYGIPTTTDGLRPWAEVDRRLTQAKVYWIATSGPGGAPHARPVDGMWIDGVLYFGGSPETRWVRDLEVNPRASIHLEDSFDVVILEGEARLMDDVPRDLAERLAAASNEKYPQYGVQTAEAYDTMRPWAFRARKGFAWSSFPRDVTRYRFDET